MLNGDKVYWFILECWFNVYVMYTYINYHFIYFCYDCGRQPNNAKSKYEINIKFDAWWSYYVISKYLRCDFIIICAKEIVHKNIECV